MSEPFAERLSRFTPAADLNRDALLFAAGRASVRPNRWWMALAGALAACQLLTLVGLWPRTPSSLPPVAVVESVPLVVPADPPIVRDPSEWGMLRDQLLASESAFPVETADGPMVSSDPPLRAFGTPLSTILN